MDTKDDFSSNDFDKAYFLWKDFKDSIIHKNRFFSNHELMKHLDIFIDNCDSVTEVDTILYRARIYDDDTSFLNHIDNLKMNDSDGKTINISENNLMDLASNILSMKHEYEMKSKRESNFWGYDSKGSFVPPDNNSIKSGRTNPDYIKYLYTSEGPYTAIVEIKPFLSSYISVAKIQCKDPLKTVDFSYESNYRFVGLARALFMLMILDFSKPVTEDMKLYIPLQYIAEYVKSRGFDALKFTSSLDPYGHNITVFSFQKCKVISSSLYKVDDLVLNVHKVAPENAEEITRDEKKSVKVQFPKAKK